MWITRSKCNNLILHDCYPNNYNKLLDLWYSSISDTRITLNNNLFPEVTFENSPIEVELVIKK